MTIKFGTDGWRGRIAEDYTFDNVRRCAQGFAAYLAEQGKRGEKVVIGGLARSSLPRPQPRCWPATASRCA
jgi:phosphomannomutase